jgi:hypothetical protein
MYINKELFDECFCPAKGIGRICLRGDRDIPNKLVQLAKEIDKENYDASCFYLDIFNGRATINYMAEHGSVDLGYVCDNYEEALEYYRTNADKADLIWAFSEGGVELC